MNKQQAIALAGGRNALAKLLGITGSAVTQWVGDVPMDHVKTLRKRRPYWFRKSKQGSA